MIPGSSETRWFTEEVQPHEPLLRAYLHKQFPQLGDVDDVVQESHLRLLRARQRGVIASAKAYLFTVARHVAIDLTRRKRHVGDVPVSDLPAWRIIEQSADAAEAASLRQEVTLAAQALDALPARCREIVTLRGVHGLAYEEIARQLGISEQTVRVQMARGLKKCADWLRERGVDGSTGP